MRSQRGSLRLHAAAAWYAADLALRRGHLAEAEDEARSALCLVDDDVSVLTGGSASVLVCALAERGAFDEARDVLRERGLDGSMEGMPWESAVIHARARLWLAAGDYERALAEALLSGSLREDCGRPNPTWTPWRSTAALALAHLGRREEAVAMADTELALAERFGAPVPIAGALHARAVAEPDDAARVALCERALAVAAGTPALLESVRARLELGSTLARMGRRIEARDALRPALSDADAAGAVLLAQRARRELVATGLRPRHAALEGAAALTPRQRQVCELAAAGKGNRQIAQALFLSIKTVETHLAAGLSQAGRGHPRRARRPARAVAQPRSKASAETIRRVWGAGWSWFEYGRLSRWPRWTSVVDPPPSRLIASRAPSPTITCASSSIDSPASTPVRRPSHATATSASSDTPSAARG